MTAFLYQRSLITPALPWQGPQRQRSSRRCVRAAAPRAPRSRRSEASDGELPGLRGGVALADLLPVDHVPPGLEVVRPAVLVLEIIGVLPHVVAEERALAVHQRRVLVRLRDERELAVRGDGDEHPAGAEDAAAGGVEVVLHLLHAAEVAGDRGFELARRLAPGAAHDLPEHRVVRVPAAVVAHERA